MSAGAAALPYPADEPAALRASSARCRRLARLADRVGDDLAHDATLLRGRWQGPAARACEAEMRSLVRLLRSLADPLHRCGGLLDEHAAELAEARGRVDRLRRQYDDLALVQPPLSLRRLEPSDARAEAQAGLAALHRLHDLVLDRVDGHARVTAHRIRGAAAQVVPGARAGGRPADLAEDRLVSLLPLLAAWRAAVGVDGAPPPAGSPAPLVRAWWAALTADEQTRMVQRFATQVGRLDGLPGAARSAANERRLAADAALLRARGALTTDELRWLRTCEVVQQQLDRVRADEDPFTLAPLTAQLLVYEPVAFGYEGRVAIAVGDVDTADHVAFLVPGLGSTVDTALSSLTSNALRVTVEARRLTPGDTTATVAWMGYDAPGLGDVVADDSAVRGAAHLARDVLAVQAARVVSPHLTVVGHSYGSTTAGTMLRDRDTGTDDVVLVGSPGPNVEHADDLRVPDGHVFVGASSRDPVSYLDRFGKDPSHESFGATRFEAEDPTRNSWRLDLDDHSKYFNEGTESLANIARVVVGDHGGVEQAPYRGEWWLLPDGINSDPEADRDPTTVP